MKTYDHTNAVVTVDPEMPLTSLGQSLFKRDPVKEEKLPCGFPKEDPEQF